MKTRVTIPLTVRRKVLEEFSHRCAICGTEKPQLHHIDENPSNNDSQNLLPLCANCHLVDQHTPTKQHPHEILRIFRKYKDPFILAPQFRPLFDRLKFVYGDIERSDRSMLFGSVQDLVAFVRELEMGQYYARRIEEIMWPPTSAGPSLPSPMNLSAQAELAEWKNQIDREYRLVVTQGRLLVEKHIVELLRFQKWQGLTSR